MTTGATGMEHVIAAQSSITWVDGINGELRYRGYPIGELAERCSFEEVAYLLWHGELPTAEEFRRLRERLRSARLQRVDLLDVLPEIPITAHPLDALRYIVSGDAVRNPLTWDNAPAANEQKSVEFAAWFPVVVAGLQRARHGMNPITPRPDLDTASNYLYMLTGKEPDPVAVETLDTSLVLHADHEFNASTFAARVTIATQSNLHAAIISALGTLSGPRHGGASDLVITMLEKIGNASHCEEYVRAELAHKRRIMGFGHRVYRTTDPRAHHLRNMAEKLLAGTEREEWMEVLAELSRIMERNKNLFPNVDLYAAVVNHALGIDPALYTSVFAVTRVVGWTAHAIEQLDGRMIRPVAEYVGPEPRSLFVTSSALR